MNHCEFKRIRETLSLTQEQLAEKLGCRSNTISRIERGELPIVEAKEKALMNLLTIQILRHE